MGSKNKLKRFRENETFSNVIQPTRKEVIDGFSLKGIWHTHFNNNNPIILELGCGWGSLSLWMAEKYPNSRITSISNSNQQREFINSAAKLKNLNNLTVVTCDMNSFDADTKFDRVVSVEMFEHMQNYERLMQNISSWLNRNFLM